MASALVRDLIDGGVHFGHRASRWNPKMSPYIFGKRNSIHIIDIRETVKSLLRSKKFLTVIVAQGRDVLFVGTKRQAREIVEKQASLVGMPYVNERWLGGTLTNFKTIRSRLARLEELENLEKSGEHGKYSKKMRSMLDRERAKIQRNLHGIRTMRRLPGALVVMDVKREYIAVREAGKLGIPVVGVVDTDSDPDGVDIVIPANDDAMRAIDLILSQLGESIEAGKRSRTAEAEASAEGGADGAGGAKPRRTRRLTTAMMAEQAVGEAAPVEAMAGQGAEPSLAEGGPVS